MGVQLEPLSQSSFEQYGPWHLHDSRFQQVPSVDIGAALLQAAVIPPFSSRTCQLTRAATSLRLPPSIVSGSSDFMLAKGQQDSAPEPPPSPKVSPKAGESSGKTPAVSVLRFNHSVSVHQPVISFPLRKAPAPPPRPDLKRRRPDTDVDGFNTAQLGCKKRRLLRNYFTSRLSQPFSLPATHILNREGAAAGDKRLLKLAAIVAARRQLGPTIPQGPLPPSPSPSSMLRRMAAMNCVRLRARNGPVQRDPKPTDVPDAPLGPSIRATGIDTHFPIPPFQLSPPLTPALRLSFQNPLSPLARARTQARASPPGSPSGLRPSEPAGAPRRLSPSPRLRPMRSPELRTTRPALSLDDVDELDDDSVAFPTSEHESRYGDEPDDVYADFGVIFGGDEESDDDGAEHYEDYLDEVDGIPWNARV
ncbi:hypothetical protein QBC47DRAFT_81595 [Echria macrotheca]|uniref:Uncharacterized protein n=1 Tax=Echria macrotheca TaxID=438768 RepID=A0AAJ0B567_9PEZI|nr:hypothetical protein QBC47DRAFT_81595 [Echria macrotheca]